MYGILTLVSRNINNFLVIGAGASYWWWPDTHINCHSCYIIHF